MLAWAAQQKPTVGQILDRIRKETGVTWREKTVDTLKTGSPETPCTGIVTTFMATHTVLTKAAAANKNLVITHEPTFYNHLDETKNFEADPVFNAKRDLIAKHGLHVFRFHDHWHLMRPDGIRTGMNETLGWTKFEKDGFYQIPTTSLQALGHQIRTTLRGRTIRIIGNQDLKVSKIAMMPGAGGSVEQMRLLSRPDVDLLVVGETREWETVEYARDAIAQGARKGLVILGHAISEEGGMRYCAKWLKTFIKDVPIDFIEAGEPFWPPA